MVNLEDTSSVPVLSERTCGKTIRPSGKTELETQTHLGYYREEAIKKKIEQVSFCGDWLVMDGVATMFGEKRSVVEPNTDGQRMAVGRIKHVGTYCANNNVVSFVDGGGHVLVAPASPDRFKALEKAGYKPGRFFVPLSNGEVLLDQTLAHKWEEMRLKKT